MTERDLVMAACRVACQTFENAGFQTEINGSKQVVVRNQEGVKILKWAPLKKWVWFYGSESPKGEHLGPGKGIVHLINNILEYKEKQVKAKDETTIDERALFGNKYKGACVYDTDGDGNCQHCFRRGGCENMGGPFAHRSKYPPGTPDHLKRGFEPK